MIGISGSLSGQKPWCNWYLTPVVNFGELETGVLKATGSYRTYSSPVKLQPWFLSLRWKTWLLDRTAALIPEFAVKDLPLDRILIYIYERRVIEISGSLSGQKPWCNWYLTPVVNFGEVESGVRKATGSYRTYSSPVKLQPWLLICGGRPDFWAELQPWFLSLQ